MAAFIAVGLVGCNDDDSSSNPCEGIVCPVGQECINGDCLDNDAEYKAGILTGNETWTNDRIWVLQSKVVVPDGVTLTIEPGTIIKGNQGVGSLATALIIARGGKIMAEGTADNPIIFTTELDNIKVGEKFGTNLTATDNSKWGGVIILGRAPISAGDGDTEAQIEGIPGNETYGRYGGDNASDNSGVFQYVSIRHGGAEIGSGNEINGLTLGGVGTGTTIDHIEVLGNLDDGVEWFGGTVNVNDVAVIYQGDDAIDIDQNWSGTLSNFAVVMGGGDGDEALEIDGPENSTYTEGFFTLENGTIINEEAGSYSVADLKSLAQGTIRNCSFQGFDGDKMLKIRESFDVDNGCADKTDALDYYIRDGRLFVENCEFVSGSATVDQIANAYINDDNLPTCEGNIPSADQDLVDQITANGGNKIVGSASIGADMSEFDWTWAAQNGIL